LPAPHNRQECRRCMFSIAVAADIGKIGVEDRELTPEALISRYLELTGEPRERICKRGRQSLERAMLMELLYRFCRITQPEIGKLLGGIDYSAVSQSRKRLQAKLEQEPELRQRYENIRDHLWEM
ncbi:MAG TPA: hypothetical protein VJZ16_02035, partial [Syntrophales bacterium]|nr:hypothetical protein [Syntrophales bacterium]